MSSGVGILAIFTLIATLFVAPPSEPGASRSPLRFEANRGQADPGVLFLARGPGYLALFGTEGVTIVLDGAQSRSATLKIGFAGAGGPNSIEPRDRLPGTSHYFIGRDPGTWVTGARSYTRIRYRELYPGIDVEFYGNGPHLEYDVLVGPEADASRMEVTFEGAAEIQVDVQGDLLIETPAGLVRQQRPRAHQDSGRRTRLMADYEVSGPGRVRFRLDPYDPEIPLVIDPVLVYSSYLGGSSTSPLGGGRDRGEGIAVDDEGNIYVTGYTRSINFPVTTGALQETDPDFFAEILNSEDAFVAKFDSSGRNLVYSTYLGGFGEDRAWAVAADSQGNAHVAGFTQAADFPVQNAFQPENAGGFRNQDAFLAKISPDGSELVFSTYLGGPENESGSGGVDEARSVALDAQGRIHIAGWTSSPGFPTMNPLQAEPASFTDGFVAAFSSDGSNLVYSTFLGGSGSEEIHGIAIDGAGNILVTGLTESTDFPVENAAQPVSGGGFENREGFVTKLNPDASQIVYSTFLGGSGEENDVDDGAIAVDPAGYAYVAGRTNSDDFPTLRAIQAQKGGGTESFRSDCFVASLSPGGQLVYATYLGGSETDSCSGIAVDAFGSATVVGNTAGSGFPFLNEFQSELASETDLFIARLKPGGSALQYSTPLGGSLTDLALDVALGPSGDAYVSGASPSPDFPVIDPFQAEKSNPNTGGFEVIVARIFDSRGVHFAQIGDGGGITSSLVLINPSNQTSNATVRIFDAQGASLGLSFDGARQQGQFDVEVPALGVSLLNSDGPGASAVTGSAVIETGGSLGGTILFAGSFGVAGVGAVEPAQAFLVPVAADESQGVNTGVALANPGGAAVEVSLKLLDAAGQQIEGAQTSVNLPARGQLARFPAELFAGAGIDLSDFQGGLLAEAPEPVSGMAIRTAGTQFATLPVSSADFSKRTLCFAQFGDGGGISSTLILVNPDPAQTASATVGVFDSQGQPLSVSFNGTPQEGTFSVSLAPLEIRYLASGGDSDPAVTGWVRVDSDVGIGGTILFEGGFGVAGVGAVEPLSRFLVPVQSSAAEGVGTGVALANPADASVEVSLSLRDAGGAAVPGGTTTVTLGAGSQLARFPGELFPGLDFTSFQGTLEVRSAPAVVGMAVRVSPGEFATLPVTPAF